MSDHQFFIRRAIELSRTNMQEGIGGPFGALIVKDGKIIGEGGNQVTSRKDPTAHAEVTAIRSACNKIDDFSLKGATIYTSCEPCPMCLSAIYWARIDKIFFANTRQDAAKIEFDDNFLYQEIGKPLSQRSIPIEQLLRDEAFAVFTEWTAKEDKITY